MLMVTVKYSFVISLCQALHETLHKLFHLILMNVQGRPLIVILPGRKTSFSEMRELPWCHGGGGGAGRRWWRWRWRPRRPGCSPPFGTIVGSSICVAFPRIHTHLRLPPIRTLHLHFFILFFHFSSRTFFRDCPHF